MKLTINPSGIDDFHNRGPINIKVSEHNEVIEAGQWNQITAFTISKYQAKRSLLRDAGLQMPRRRSRCPLSR